MDRLVPFVVGEHYHVFNRGVDKQVIFKDESDRKRLQTLLYLCNGSRAVDFRAIKGDPFVWNREQTLVDVLSYAFMPNHIHVILHEHREGGISKFVNKLLTAYSMYFNTKYQRTGPLMCRPFRSSHITDDEYFRWVLSYVHLNPLEIFDPTWKSEGLPDLLGAREFMREYKYSSFADYFLRERGEQAILNKSALPIDMRDLQNMDDMLVLLRDAKEQNAFGAVERFLS